jgi:hypothetical protein
MEQEGRFADACAHKNATYLKAIILHRQSGNKLFWKMTKLLEIVRSFTFHHPLTFPTD